MLGRKKSSLSTVVYLAYPPYIQDKTAGSDPLSTHPSFKETQTQFIAYILRWCLQKDIVIRSGDGEYLLPKLDKNIASLSYLLHVHNFQHLVYDRTLDAFMEMIADNQSTLHMTTIQQLAISLLAIYEPEFIHYQINRVYRAFAAYPLSDPDLTWPEIHQQYPFMWVVLTIHLLVKNFTEVA